MNNPVGLLQIFLIVFILFALSRVVLRLKSKELTFGEFLFWFGLFAFALVGVIKPKFTTYAAEALGIGRGADVVIYASLVLLFYLIFRTNVLIENLKHDLTKVIQEMALKDQEKPEPTTKKIKKP